MKAIHAAMLALMCSFAARADFSYTQTRKSAQGMMGAAAGDQTSKVYYKGQKTKTDSGATATIIDFDAQTITNINHQQKTYTVVKFSDAGQAMKDAGVDAKIDVRETGQRKSINGYNAAEVLMTVALENPQASQMGMKMQMEMSMWLSPDVPGTPELRAFHQKNIDRFPWSAVAGGGGNPGMQKAMADMQKKMASLGGVPVLQVVRVKNAASGPQAAQMQQAMEQARARMEAMRQQGGAQAQAAEQAMARMGAMGGGGTMFEMTTESSGFSTNPIPDSIFAIPEGYQKK